jgi:hypothetical protein
MKISGTKLQDPHFTNQRYSLFLNNFVNHNTDKIMHAYLRYKLQTLNSNTNTTIKRFLLIVTLKFVLLISHAVVGSYFFLDLVGL